MSDLLSGILDSRQAATWTATVGRVDVFNASEQSASVQPLVRQGFFNEAGERETDRLPVIHGVPVLFPGIAGDRYTFPIKKGDLVLLVFTSQSIDKWLHYGGEVDPGDDRRNTLSDAVAIPGLYSFNEKLTESVPNNASVIWASQKLKLGGPSTTSPGSGVIRASDLQSALTGVLSDSAVATAIAGVAAPGGATALAAAVTAYFVSHPVTGSTRVEAA